LRYPGTEEHQVIVVLHSFSGLGEDYSVNLQPVETEWEKREFEIELLSDISLSKLTDSEKSGLATYVQSRQLQNEPHATPSGMDGPQYKIEFTFEINDRSSTQVHRHSSSESTAMHGCEKASELAYDVLTGLRLFKPSSPSAYLGPAYELKTNWHSRTLDVAGIGSSNIHRHTEYRSNIHRYHMRPHEIPYFESFWDKYGDVTNHDSLSNPTRRFNQIYQKSSVEDQILDIFIGIESSILTDTDAMYSYRLPIRTLLLLHDESKYDGEYLFDLSELLYGFRNDIVHNNQSLELLIQRKKDRGDFSDSSIESDIKQYEFRDRARYLLAKTIIRYSDLCGSSGVGINKFNKKEISEHANDLLKHLPDLETQLNQKLEDRI
ncbi:HEPN domain-containing protein, partial [Halobacterium salinarum]